MMKRMKKIYTYAIAAIAATAFSACENTLNEPGFGGNTTPSPSLVKPADVTVWSGQQVLGSTFAKTRGADVNGNLWYQNWDRPTNITEEEIAKVLEEANKVREGAVNDIHIDWNNYWVQQVHTGQQTYVDGYGNDIGTGSSHMNHLLAYTNKVKEQTAWWPEPEFILRDKHSYEDVYDHINNFNSGANNTEYTDDETGENYYGTTLMTDMYADGIIDQFGYHNSTDSRNHFEYIILEVDGSYYVCFDFYATHPDGQEANKNMDVERDWIFNDWIVKISPAYLKGQTPEKPGDESSDPEGPSTGDDNNGSEDQPVTPPVNASQHHSNEVEVNLSIQDTHSQYDVEDLVTKLSIHVRYPHDVKVRIPVPTKYFVETDDLNIVEAHYLVLEKYGKDHSSVYNVNGNEVTLTVTYTDTNDMYEEIYDGNVMFIVVTTSGINEDVIDYLMEKNGDGINFEVWNYYKFNEYDAQGNLISSGGKPAESQIRELKTWLDKALISFVDNVDPHYYINAFNDTEDNPRGVKDCTVTPTSKWIVRAKGMSHLNGSLCNEIYYYTENPDVWHPLVGEEIIPGEE